MGVKKRGQWGWMGKLKVAPCHWSTDSGAVVSVGDEDVHNPQDTVPMRPVAVCRWLILTETVITHQSKVSEG